MIKDQIGAVIVCDEVRVEANGKHLLIGVYSGYIVVPSMPISVNLSFWIEYLPKVLGRQALYVKALFTTGFEIAGRVEMEIKEIQPFSIILPPASIRCEGEGELIVQVSTDQKDWDEVKRKAIRIGPVGTTGVSPSTLPSR